MQHYNASEKVQKRHLLDIVIVSGETGNLHSIANIEGVFDKYEDTRLKNSLAVPEQTKATASKAKRATASRPQRSSDI